MEISKCLGCMEEFQGYPCPNCGFEPGQMAGTEYALPMESILAGKYLIGRVLGQGGFGITYVGWDLALERKVAIKEYYPSGQVSRSPGTRMLTWYTGESARNARQDGMQAFLKEARKMSKLDEIPGVVKVRDLFQENNTAYIVMDFVEGRTLKSLLLEKGPMTWEQAKAIFEPVLQAMEQVHEAGVIHRDLSPDNLMITKGGRVKVLDLGAAKDLSINSGASSMQVAKGGFSPFEQYTQRGSSGPWTDVYAMAATIYYTLTGKVPPVAMDRVYEDNLNWDHPNLRSLPAPALEALKKAMAVQSRNRTQTMEELEQGLFREAPKPPKPELPKPELPRPEPPKPSPEKKRSKWLIPAVVAVLAILCGAGLWMMQNNSKASQPSLAEYATKATTEPATKAATEATTEPATKVTTEATTEPATKATTEATSEPTTEATTKASLGAMTHEEFLAAELDSPVCVETYVQAHQSWWDGKITVYAQSEDGAYFLYNMACSEKDAAKLVPGTKILVNGYKAEWSGEVEIIDATFEVLEGSFIAEACDVTELLGTPELIDHQNEFVTIKGLTVEKVAFKNDEPGDDIYVTFSLGEHTAEFCVEAYLTGPETDVYAAVSALNVGDVVDIEGFLYWYNGANTHITGVPPSSAALAETPVPGVIKKVALVTDFFGVDDESFNQACWQGVEAWCQTNGIAYTYYQPVEDSNDARVLSVFQAVNEGANAIVMPGYLFGPTVLTVQDELPDVYFIAVDVAAGDLTFDFWNYYEPSANVACLTFSEEQAGYLAGYAAVKEGYTKLGFLGGMAVPAVIRYGYGFVQGADAAAKETGAAVEINYTYGGQFFGSPEITAKMEGWYRNGTEVVFACGGGIYTSALEAAEKNGGKVIGVEVDQSHISPLIITSAMKGLQNATEALLESLNTGDWATYGGKVTNLGLLEGEYVGLPTATWSLQNFSVEAYEAVKERIKSGAIVVSNSIDAMPEVSITVNEIA